MREECLTLVLDGRSVQNGEIDVRDLAPALLAMGDLIQAANTELNGNRSHMSVRVRATAEGSFQVTLVTWQSFVEAAKALFDFTAENHEGITSANELIDLLFKVGGVGGAACGGLFALIKFLKGQKPDRIEQGKNQGDVNIHKGGVCFVTNQKTINLLQSIQVREQARKAASVLSREGLETLSIKREGETTVTIEKSNISDFDFDESEKEIANETRTITLQIISLSFKEDNKWKVTDGSEPFSATIADQAFLNRIAQNEIAFSKGDFLVCEVQERQLASSKGLKKDRIILTIKEHKKAPIQLDLLK